jgi:Ca2+-binding RTX toxin-like protein
MKKQILAALALLALSWFVTTSSQAALIEGTKKADVLGGGDDDNVDNLLIQPPGTVVNQSLDNADVLLGDLGNDVIVGFLGSDTMHGGPGRDILIGGLEAGTTSPKSDIVFGDEGNDVNIWAGGDGSDAFMGGPGRDALVMANVDRSGVRPILTEPVPGFPNGLPTADATGQNGFCTLEQIPDGNRLGYAFLVRFFSKAAGNALLATVRVDADVEQVYCTSQDTAAITFADLTAEDPQFADVSIDEVDQLNHTVAQIIR